MKFIFIFLLFLLNLFPLYSQIDEFEKYLQEQDEKFKQYQNHVNSNFDSYRDSINRKFADYLAKSWEKHSAFKGITPPETPKPNIIPKINPDEFPQEKTKIPTESIIKNIAPTPSKPVVSNIPDIKPEVVQSQNLQKTNIHFYQSDVSLNYNPAFLKINLPNINEKEVAEFWKSLSESNYMDIISQLNHIVHQQNLNNMGVYRLISKSSKALFPNKKNEEIITTVFLLNQFGFKAKIGKTADRLICLLPVLQKIYAQSFIENNHGVYYIFEADEQLIPKSYSNIYTYDDFMENCTQSIDLNIDEPLKIDNSEIHLIINTKFAGNINVNVNAALIDFYKNYPQTEMQIYANTELSEQVQNSLLTALQTQLKDLSSYDAVSFLLKFIHNSFKYQTDNEQFGYEKPMFCEETLYYPYSDCEDNSILFSYLVRKLLGLEVVLLDYPGHIATAVNFTENINGDYVLVNKKRFTVCDPTYFGANIGMSMPQFKGQSVKIIELKKLNTF